MCPACIATLALVYAGVFSMGGLTALVVNKLHAKTGAKRIDLTTQTREQGGEQDESSASCVAS